MKMIMKSVAVAGVTMFAVTTMLAKGGQPIHNVHFSSKVVFTNANAGVDTDASASAQLSSTMNNNSDRETLTVSAKGLTPSGPYSLFASVGGTNTDLVDFNADKKGNAKLSLKNTGTQKKPATLLAGLELFSVTELDIENTSSSNAPVTVLTADASSPSTFVFSDKQTQTGTTGATGTLSITASSRGGAKLGLTASGLNPGQDYVLALSSGSTTGTNTTFTADTKGNLKVNATTTSNVLDLTEVDLTDTSSTVIIPFPLP